MSLLKRLSLGQRVRRDKITDLRELVELEQRQWGPRLRHISSLGEPMAGLGFAGAAVPNNEVVVSPASVSSQTEISLYTLASTGASTWMYIPTGNFRSPQGWRIWAGGTFSTGATTTTLTWTSRLGISTTASANASIGATGPMAPGSVIGGGVAATAASAFPWWFEGHFTVRSPGTAGTAIGAFNIELACQSPASNTLTGMGGGASFTLDTTQGAFVCLDITSSASPGTGAQLQQMTIVAWD